ncbi:vWA domain-containing protein [Bordetella avium]|uniref:VWA domain-containing protein n=1 Tax=Bordetella avium (strain 197N) TaxID=360910 RepID=Q2KWA9_BORA1|nr:VWA domain-containing protein [Bordetella avium]AZY50046.1 VWA domain-containing protein [Bordetella avium]AZY53411.1 VWA domain-containing protein [Bordetella avium]RIQ12996.1 VWA domain-containing protein [Bordetella avium]RIQ17403.1 VWA domain-containing protein [Bordetella avium]RIQ33890.1 VWA domain-containing protein [Bordetella avium]
MLTDFFYHLRAHRLPVSVNEYLTLLEALRTQVMPPTLDDFYFLARTTLVKDESLFDRYDQAFGSYYKQIAAVLPPEQEIPLDWLIKAFEKNLSEEEKAAIQQHGWDKLMALFKERLAEQKERHAGGSKWIGTGGSSPFGNGGYHPEGIRVGGESAGHRTAVKVWEMRQFRDYDDQVELGTRNFKVALRRLRRFAREGADLELDLDDTIASTARNAGHLDLRLLPERRNSVKVLMLLDVGGSMDDHIARIEELFSAARSEFRNLEVYYFHNCPYETLWQQNTRRQSERFDTWDVLRKYNPDWRLIMVGDATMSPYEILHPGGSVEHYNKEAGAVWMRRLLDAWPKAVWLNPEPSAYWQYRQSIALMRDIMQGRMFPVTVAGLEQAMRLLAK